MRSPLTPVLVSLLLLSTVLDGVAEESSPGPLFEGQASGADAPHAPPFEVLEKLYREATVPASPLDFDPAWETTNLHCAVAEADSKLWRTRIRRSPRVTDPPADFGPLFPRQPAIDYKVALAWGQIPVNSSQSRTFWPKVSMSLEGLDLVSFGKGLYSDDGTHTLKLRRTGPYIAFSRQSSGDGASYGYCWRIPSEERP